MSNTYKNFEELAKALKIQEKQNFQIYFEKGDYNNAFDSIKGYKIKEQQKFLYKKDIGIVYYEMFKEKFSNQDFKHAEGLLEHAHNLDSHNELYLKRRKLFNRRKLKSDFLIEEAEKNLLEQPKISEPNFKFISKSYSMGVYKWKGDSGRFSHKWSNFITDFKGGDKKLSLLLGQLLGDFVLKRTNLVKSCDIIVPVASDPKRSYKRGFEITQVLAEGVSCVVAMPVMGNYLARSESDHAKNLRKLELVNSYFSNPEKSKQIEGKSILLIDDICTSGRTLNTCAEILINGGARSVYSVVLSRAESTMKRLDHGAVLASSGDSRTRRLAAWFRLMRSEKLGPRKIQKLIEKYNTPDSVLSQSEKELKTNKGIGEKVAKGIISQSKSKKDYHLEAIEQYEFAERIKCKIWDINERDYPRILLKSKMPSTILNIRGNDNYLSNIKKSIAIIGSRNITSKSTEFIKTIMPALVKDGWTIISGLAIGVDATAHSSCLDNNGYTAGVLGNGVDVIYPKENKQLFNRMIKDGVLVSEFNFGSSVSEMRLKKRNKVITGLSNIVFVVQTMPKGGAMNAVRAAKENTRPVITWNDEKIINLVEYSGNKEIIENDLGYGITSYNIIKQINDVCDDFRESVEAQLSLL
mgnify:CR=1 FL=1